MIERAVFEQGIAPGTLTLGTDRPHHTTGDLGARPQASPWRLPRPRIAGVLESTTSRWGQCRSSFPRLGGLPLLHYCVACYAARITPRRPTGLAGLFFGRGLICDDPTSRPRGGLHRLRERPPHRARAFSSPWHQPGTRPRQSPHPRTCPSTWPERPSAPCSCFPSEPPNTPARAPCAQLLSHQIPHDSRDSPTRESIAAPATVRSLNQ